MLSNVTLAIQKRFGSHVSQVLHGMFAYGSAELVGRVVRLATTIVIARQLTPEIVGEAALALTIFELIRVLERVGTGQQIVIAGQSELAAVCNTVRRIYWVWTAVLMLAQLGAAAIFAFAFHRHVAGGMLAALALVFPFMAGGHVQFFLAMRDGKVGHLAKTNAMQVVVDQAMTLVLMLAWPSPWAIVIPKILAAPIWLACALKAHPWSPDHSAGFLPLRHILRSSGSILLADALVAVRTQGDNLIIASLLGTKMLGTYYFAFNAGLGIITSLVNAFGSVIFPMLARSEAGVKRQMVLRKTAAMGLMVFLPFVALQTSTTTFYVPLVFGPHWAPAANLVSILCLAGIGMVVGQITTAWLRANGRMEVDAFNSLLNCLASLGGLAVGALSGSLTWAAWGLVCGNLVATTWIALRHLAPPMLSFPSPFLAA